MAFKPFNSANGFSVGQVTHINIADSNGNITANGLTVSAKANLGPVGNVIITGGSSGQAIITDGAGNLSFTTISSSSLTNGTSNIQILNNSNILFSSAGNANIMIVTGTGVNVDGTFNASGNVTAGNFKVDSGLQSNRPNVSVTTNTVIDQFSPLNFRTAKYIISASSPNGYQSVEALLVQDGTDSYITIYGSICSNVSADIIEVSSNINNVSGNVALYATSSGGTATVNLITTYLQT